jgi:hypothetical protein
VVCGMYILFNITKCRLNTFRINGGRVCSMVNKGWQNLLHTSQPERKRPLGRPRRRWEDNIKMNESVEITNKMQLCNRIYYSKVY